MKTSLIAVSLAAAAAATSHAALYNVSYTLTGSHDEGWGNPGEYVTTYDFSIVGQLDIVNGIAISGSMTVTDHTVKNWGGYTSYGLWGNMNGAYSLGAGDGSGNVQSWLNMGFDNRFNVNASNPLSVGTASYGGTTSGLSRVTSGGLLFVMDGPNPASNGITIYQAEAGTGYSYGLKLNGIENDGGGVEGGSLSFSPVTAPAPGALALLGLAGLAARRRRA